MHFIFATILAFAIAVICTPIIRRAARYFKVVDVPSSARKIHRMPIPLMGGVAIFLAILGGVVVLLALGWLPGIHIKEKYLIGMLIALFLLIIGGILDDKYNLSPRRQIIWPVLAAFVIIASGIGIRNITNPFGGQFFLDRYTFIVLWWEGIPYRISLIADIFTFFWLLGMTYTTKLLDGLDGLVSGLMVIGAIVVAFVSMTKEVAQPDTALLACVVAGAFLGFLVFNFNPASIFLGEGGSTLAGFMLGVLAIISGGKIATTLLVIGLPLFDAGFVILRRFFVEKRSPTSGDRSHLHFRLLDLGLSHRQVVLFYYFMAALFGISTLVLRGWEKIVALVLLLSILLVTTAMGIGIFKKRV